MQAITAYMDWNVFNKLETIGDLADKERIMYQNLEKLIIDGSIVCPYSNAHISDLHRGYLKTTDYIAGHLHTIERLTNSLCIVQYWGEKEILWHYRDPKAFFKETTDEATHTAKSFSTLFDSIDNPLAKAGFELKKLLLQYEKLEPSFKEIYKADPIFNSIFPRAKTQMNKLALCEDIYDFAAKVKSDYALYKNFRKFLNQCKAKFPTQRSMYTKVESTVIGKPSYLTWDSLWEKIDIQPATTSNAVYDTIIHLFTTTDLKGYRQDERFANMIDDSLHCFYGAHCNYFLTTDSRCYDKSKTVYRTLDIKSTVLTPEQFIQLKEIDQQ